MLGETAFDRDRSDRSCNRKEKIRLVRHGHGQIEVFVQLSGKNDQTFEATLALLLAERD